jgi:hypothetical protein
MRNAVFAASTALALVFAGPAGAHVTVIDNPAGNLEEMLFNEGDQFGNSVFVHSHTTTDEVMASSGQVLSTTGSGFAQISGDNSGHGPALSFDSITFTPVSPLSGFTGFQYNAHLDNTLDPTKPSAPTYLLSWVTNDGTGSQTITYDMNKKVRLLADSGEIIESITLSDVTGFDKKGDPASGAFDHIKQISIRPIGVVPEPSEWSLMVVGTLALGGLLRRRRAMTAEA